MADQKKGRLLSLGPRLIANGYLLVPLAKGQKRPTMKDWTKLRIKEKDLPRLAKDFPDCNLGLLTRDTPAIDNDIPDPALAALMHAEVEMALDGPLCIRTGRAPKRLVLCRTDKPFPKVSTQVWLDDEGNSYGFEILCDGQQFAASGIHPDTGKRYEWEDKARTPLTVPASDLPLLTLEKAKELVDIALFHFKARGLKKKAKNQSLSTLERVDYDSDDIANVSDPISDLSDEEIEERLRMLEWDGMSYEEWTNTCAAMKHQFRDNPARGEELWHELSALDPRYKERQAREKWQSFRRNDDGNAKTFRYVLKMTEEKWRAAHPISKESKAKYARAAKIALDLVRFNTESSVEDYKEALEKDEKTRAWAADPKNVGVIERVFSRAVETVAEKPWLSNMILSQTGDSIIACLHNAAVLFREDPAWKGVLCYDVFRRGKAKRRPIPRFGLDELSADYVEQSDYKRPEAWSEMDTTDARIYLQQSGIMLSLEDTRAALDRVAFETPYHPLQEYLKGLKWDGKKRIDRFFETYLGAGKQPPEYLRGVSRMFLLSMVARAMQPGCKVDYMPVVYGFQGDSKSMAFEVLAGGDEFFSDDLPSIGEHNVRTSMHLRAKWLIEVAEMDAFNKAEVETLKSFISRKREKYTPLHAREEVDEPRTCVFCGSTNEPEFLKDATGNRRYWPIRVIRIMDVEGIRRDRDQLFAEALAAFQAGEPWWPTTEFRKNYAEIEQAASLERDPREHAVWKWLQGRRKEGFTVEKTHGLEVWVEALQGNASQFDPGKARQVGRLLNIMGFTRHNDGNSRLWKPPPIPSEYEDDPAFDI